MLASNEVPYIIKCEREESIWKDRGVKIISDVMAIEIAIPDEIEINLSISYGIEKNNIGCNGDRDSDTGWIWDKFIDILMVLRKNNKTGCDRDKFNNIKGYCNKGNDTGGSKDDTLWNRDQASDTECNWDKLCQMHLR